MFAHSGEVENVLDLARGTEQFEATALAVRLITQWTYDHCASRHCDTSNVDSVYL